MKDIIPHFSRDLPQPIGEDRFKSNTDDNLGAMLQGKWQAWSDSKLQIEKEMLTDLRAFNQIPEPDHKSISKFHSHIYLGITRTKCISAYSRICDILFNSSDPHWDITPTTIPEMEPSDILPQDVEAINEEAKKRAESMKKEVQDQMLDLRYDDAVKAAIMESCIIGTGVVKGIIPGTKKIEKWAQTVNPDTETQEWTVEVTEIPFPKLSAVSAFDIFPDPFAKSLDDMSGLFERHRLNRKQFSDLREDERFDTDKINELLRYSEKGNHDPLSNEIERNSIANITDTSASESGRYDLLEYWGQVTGRLLASAGIDGVEDEETYWANVWTCGGKTLLAKLAPMKKQRIPYNFFFYSKVPHQFWGIAPSRMMRHTQNMLNGTVQALLDGMVMAAYPMAEVNVAMLKHGQDPNVMLPGMTYLRDSGDPSVPAVRFFQPNSPSGQLLQMIESFKSYADDETALPAYTYGDQSAEINKTAKGMSMQMGAASLPLKLVVKNLEDFGLIPLIRSLFDWNMEWSDKEEIKGDMEINVLATSALMAKEVRNQQLMQFATLTANPVDAAYVDRKYLLTQIAKSMEIDTKKAIPENPEGEQPPMPGQEQPQVSVVDQAKAELIKMQALHEQEKINKTIAETAATNIEAQFEAIQTAGQVLLNPGTIPVGDDLMKSAGYKDHNGAPLVQQPMQQPIIDNVPQNTSPQFPANPPGPEQIQPQQPMPIEQPAMPSPANGIETAGNEPM